MKCDYKKVTQTINYLIRKDSLASGINELKIIKLIWASDRYHLRKYARTVSGDDYYAMKNGPVGSMIKDVAEFCDNSYSNLVSDNFPYIGSFIKFEKNNEYALLSSINDVDYKELSKTDIEALDFAWNNFGSFDSNTLIEITHKYPEWKKHEDTITRNCGGREKINQADFFLNPSVNDDPFEMNHEALINSKKIFLEYS